MTLCIVDIHLDIKFVQTLELWSSCIRKGKAKKCLKIHMKDTSLIPILLKPFFNLFERRQLFCTAAEPDPVH